MQWDQKKSSDKTEFGLQEVLSLDWEIKGRHVLANLNNLGTLYLLFSVQIYRIQELHWAKL